MSTVFSHVAVPLSLGLGLGRHIVPGRVLLLGCLFAINSDAHRAERLDYIRFGVSVARRGRLPKEAIINTWPVDRFLDFFAQKLKNRAAL